MTISTFIEKAIEGGIDRNDFPDVCLDHPCISETAPWLLSPRVWKAVGKVEGWGSGCNVCLKDPSSYASGWADACKRSSEHLTREYKFIWVAKMHRMIDFLEQGKTIDQYLDTL